MCLADILYIHSDTQTSCSDDSSSFNTFHVEDKLTLVNGYYLWANRDLSLIYFGLSPRWPCSERKFWYYLKFEQLCSDTIISTTRTCHCRRTGIMCGKCESNLTVAINSLWFECIPCNDYYGLLLYIGIQIIPLTVLLLLLMFFRVSLNYLSMNAYILFSQMVTLWFPWKPYPFWLPKGLWRFSSPNWFVYPYSIWSLDFMLTFSSSTVQAIAFQYITAFYPLLFIAFIYAWLEMYARGVRPVFYITRPALHLLVRLS